MRSPGVGVTLCCWLGGRVLCMQVMVYISFQTSPKLTQISCRNDGGVCTFEFNGSTSSDCCDGAICFCTAAVESQHGGLHECMGHIDHC
jgi:hypothetical protein